MELLEAFSVGLCDTYLCCNNFYTGDKPPFSPDPEGYEEAVSLPQESDDSEKQLTDRHEGWESCDIRKPAKTRPTLKALAEDYIRAQRVETAIRETVTDGYRERERRDGGVAGMKKELSFVTTDGDDDSLDFRASSACSVASLTAKKYLTSREVSDESDRENNRPCSKLETDSKDSGYGAEIRRSKRDFPKQESTDNDCVSPIPISCPTADLEISEITDISEKSKSEKTLKTKSINRKKSGLFSSFRSKKSSKEDKSRRKKASSSFDRPSSSDIGHSSGSINQTQNPRYSLITPKPAFVLKGKRSPEHLALIGQQTQDVNICRVEGNTETRYRYQ